MATKTTRETQVFDGRYSKDKQTNNELLRKYNSLSITAESTKLVSMQTAKIVLKNNPTLLKAMSTVKESFSRVLVKPIAKI